MQQIGARAISKGRHADTILADTDGGVVEKDRWQVQHAINMGHTTGSCHIANMRDPAQCLNQARNTRTNTNVRY
jgi:hypothetical protein